MLCISRKSYLTRLLLVFSIAVLSACSAQDPQTMTGQELETLKFRVSVEGIAFDVPVNYHYGDYSRNHTWPRPPRAQIEGKERRKVDVIRILTLMPDLSPYTEENAADFEARGWGKKVSGYLTRRRVDWNYWFSNTFKRTKRMTDQPEMPGMLRYRDPLAKHDLYLSHNRPLNDTSFRRITCPDYKPTQSPSCTLDAHYLDRFDLQIRFSRTYLHNWKDIEKKMKTVFDSFRSSAEQ